MLDAWLVFLGSTPKWLKTNGAIHGMSSKASQGAGGGEIYRICQPVDMKSPWQPSLVGFTRGPMNPWKTQLNPINSTNEPLVELTY